MVTWFETCMQPAGNVSPLVALLCQKELKMQSFQRLCVRGGFLFFVLFIAGCRTDDTPVLYPVTGTVSFDGQPVAKGEIIFTPTKAGQTPDAGQIKDGTFSFKSRDGIKRVSIKAYREVPGKTQPDPVTGTRPLTENYIPEVYSTQSKLKATVTDNPEENRFKFVLTADGK